MVVEGMVMEACEENISSHDVKHRVHFSRCSTAQMLQKEGRDGRGAWDDMVGIRYPYVCGVVVTTRDALDEPPTKA